MSARIVSNTDKTFHCIQCGSTATSIVRESPDPRLKCNDCNFLFNGSDSKAAEEAGAIPNGPPKLQESVLPKTPRSESQGKETQPSVNVSENRSTELSIPRTPSYVFISKKRDAVEFCNKKDLKRVAVKWQYENIPHDVFELSAKLIRAKIEIE